MRHNFFLFSVFAVVLFLNRSVMGQWVQTNGPDGGNVISFAAKGSDLFAGTAHCGVFYSSNSAMSWIAANSGLTFTVVQALAIIDTNLIAATDHGMFLSSNKGTSWTPINNGLPSIVQSLVVSGTSIYAGSRDSGIFLSTDNGESWGTINSDLPNHHIQALAVKPSPDGINTNLIVCLPYNFRTKGGIFVSSNNGSSWTLADSNLNYINVFGVSGSNLFAGATYSGLLLSTDNGTNWKPINHGLPDHLNINAIVTKINNNTKDTDLFVSSIDSGIYQSTDNGANWKAANEGLNTTAVNSLIVSGHNLFAGTNDGRSRGGVYISTNNGASWTTATTQLTGTEIVSLGLIGSKIFAGTSDRWSGGGIFLSTDEGGVWTPMNNGLPNDMVSTIAVKDTILFAGTHQYGVYRSTDYGSSWIKTGWTEPLIYALAVKGDDIYAGTELGIFHSTDNGTTWAYTSVGFGIVVSAIGLIDTNIFATSGNSMFLSTDKGVTWQDVGIGLVDKIVMSFAAIGTKLFAGTLNGVFLSTNYGASWTAMNSGLKNDSVWNIVAIDTNLFAMTDGGLYLSTNYGKSWYSVNQGFTDSLVFPLKVSGKNVFAGTARTGVWRRPLSEMITGNAVEVLPHVNRSTKVYPNPSSQSTTINFSSLDHGFAQVIVVNLLGSEVARLFTGELEAGEHSFTWDANQMPQGMYECVIQMNGKEERAPMIVVR